MSTLKELGIIELEMRIGLDTYHPKVRVTQYDSGLTLEYDVVDRNGEVVTDLPDVVPVLYVESPDKSAIGSAEGEIVDGKAVIPIPGSLLSKFGEAEAQVQLVNSKTKEQIHDNTFILDIAQSKMDGEVTVGESIWFNLQDLKEAIASVQQLESQYTADVQAVETMREDVTTKHGEVTTMHSSLQDVFDTEAARVNAENTRTSQETARVTAESARASEEDTRKSQETARVNAEDTREMQESSRQSAETERKEQFTKSQDLYTKGNTLYNNANPLYADLLAIKEILGTDPSVQVAQEVAELQTELKEIEDVVKAVQHEADNGADLIEEGGKLYRSKVEVIESVPTLTHAEVGFFIKDDIKPWTANKTGTLYFKTQGQAEATILIYSLDESIKLAAKIDNRTMMYSAPVTTGELYFNMLNAAGQKVKIWDLEVR